MNTRFYLIPFAFVAMLFICSCSSDDDTPQKPPTTPPTVGPTTPPTSDPTVPAIIVVSGHYNSRHYVDLGLPSGLLWAAYNIGVNGSKLFGDRYKWGATALTGDDARQNTGTRMLANTSDVATVNWGGKWRMPTRSDFIELCNECEWEWQSASSGFGVAGYKFISKTHPEYYIFLPAAGYETDGLISGLNSLGDYWASNPAGGNEAYEMYFSVSGVSPTSFDNRGYAFSVRPVVDASALSQPE